MDFRTPALNASLLSDPTAERAFLSRVYLWMAAGLAISASVALFTLRSETVFSLATGHYLALALGELGLVFGLSFWAPRMSAAMAGAAFAAYAALNGLTFSVVLVRFQLGSVAQVFLVCALAFGALSLYGVRTKKNLTAWRSFLYIGLFGLVGAGLVNLFVRSDGLSFVTSCMGVLVFAGLTAYDTQKLRGLHGAAEGQKSLHIVGALILYLDFVNLFISLLRLFGRRR